MEIAEARYLTDIFNGKAPGYTTDLGKTAVSVVTPKNSGITVKAYWPMDIARYLMFFRDTPDPLFRRGALQMSEGQLPDPIQLKVTGRYRDSEASMDWYDETLARFRFFDSDKPSEMCLHFDFQRTDWENPLHRRQGPSLNDMIRILNASGDSWAKINFLPPRDQVRRDLKLVVG